MAQTFPSLLQRLRANPGDRAAWEHFDTLYRPLLTSWLQRNALQHHYMDDQLQEVLAAVVREMPSFQYNPEKGRFRDWLRQILVNRLREFWRQRQASSSGCARKWPGWWKGISFFGTDSARPLPSRERGNWRTPWQHSIQN